MLCRDFPLPCPCSLLLLFALAMPVLPPWSLPLVSPFSSLHCFSFLCVFVSQSSKGSQGVLVSYLGNLTLTSLLFVSHPLFSSLPYLHPPPHLTHPHHTHDFHFRPSTSIPFSLFSPSPPRTLRAPAASHSLNIRLSLSNSRLSPLYAP